MLSKEDARVLDQLQGCEETYPPSGGIFDPVVQKLKTPYSELRSGDSTWTLWHLLSIWMDNLMPIFWAYRGRLLWFSDHISIKVSAGQADVDIPGNIVQELLQTKRELD